MLPRRKLFSVSQQLIKNDTLPIVGLDMACNNFSKNCMYLFPGYHRITKKLSLAYFPEKYQELEYAMKAIDESLS